MAEEKLQATLTDLRRGTIENTTRADATFADAAAEFLRYIRDDREREASTLNDLRHGFGTLAVQAFPITDVQGYLGHAHISTTMRYVHHTPGADDAARLQAVLSRDVSPTVSRIAAIGRN